MLPVNPGGFIMRLQVRHPPVADEAGKRFEGELDKPPASHKLVVECTGLGFVLVKGDGLTVAIDLETLTRLLPVHFGFTHRSASKRVLGWRREWDCAKVIIHCKIKGYAGVTQW